MISFAQKAFELKIRLEINETANKNILEKNLELRNKRIRSYFIFLDGL